MFSTVSEMKQNKVPMEGLMPKPAQNSPISAMNRLTLVAMKRTPTKATANPNNILFLLPRLSFIHETTRNPSILPKYKSVKANST